MISAISYKFWQWGWIQVPHISEEDYTGRMKGVVAKYNRKAKKAAKKAKRKARAKA